LHNKDRLGEWFHTVPEVEPLEVGAAPVAKAKK